MRGKPRIFFKHKGNTRMSHIGIPELAEGEIYVGIVGDMHGNAHHVILLPGDNDDATFADAIEWAKSIGGDLPTRVEQAMLWASHRGQFRKDLYWSNETHHESDEYAWFQTFYDGCQYDGPEDSGHRARAVRRLPI